MGIGAAGKVYFGYQRDDGHPWIAVSDDKGVSWHDNQEVGTEFGIENSTFPVVVAGDNLRAAYAFLGTLSEGDYGDPANFSAVWHLFVATTFDGGVTWTTVDATPHDPVQRGSICNQGTTTCDARPGRPQPARLQRHHDRQVRRGCWWASRTVASPTPASSDTRTTTPRRRRSRASRGKRLLAAVRSEPRGSGASEGAEVDRGADGSGRRASVLVEARQRRALITSYKIYRGVASGAEVLLTSTAGEEHA